MPISALVISLSVQPDIRDEAIEYLSVDSRFTIGELSKQFLPVVLETSTLGEGAAIVKKDLLEVPGIEFVRVVSVDFSDLDPDSSDFGKRPKKRVKR